MGKDCLEGGGLAFLGKQTAFLVDVAWLLGKGRLDQQERRQMEIDEWERGKKGVRTGLARAFGRFRHTEAIASPFI